MKKYEVKKYLKSGKKWGKHSRYFLETEGLELYFNTIKEAQEYFEKYLK